MTDHVEQENRSIPILKIGPEAEQEQVARLSDLRKSRDPFKMAGSLEELQEMAACHQNIMPALIKTVRAKATILDASGTTGSVAGYQMVELTLEVWPKKGGVPFQVKRKFSAGRLGPIEAGRKLDVYYDPSNPEKLDLA